MLLGFFLFLSCHYIKTYSANEIPKIEFLNDTISFGTIKPGDSAIVSYEFKNKGYSNLKLISVETGCNCSIVNFPKGEFKLNAGSTIVIKYLNAIDLKKGVINKIFIVQTNCSPSIKILTLTGIVM